MSDWDLGRYELTAADLQPVAERVVAMANPLRGEKVLDIACGTGNAAILAARFKAEVTGVDLASRLLDVARERAAAEKLSVTFTVADAQALPFQDRSFDVALSIFGLIFAADRERAFAELARVLRPGGRGFFTVWRPGGAIDKLVNVFVKAVSEATGSSRPAPPFEWHDSEAIQALAGRHGVLVNGHEGEIRLSAPSPGEYLATHLANHPMSVAMKPPLKAAGTFDRVAGQALDVLNSENEDPGAFNVTSRYRVIEVRR